MPSYAIFYLIVAVRRKNADFRCIRPFFHGYLATIWCTWPIYASQSFLFRPRRWYEGAYTQECEAMIGSNSFVLCVGYFGSTLAILPGSIRNANDSLPFCPCTSDLPETTRCFLFSTSEDHTS